MLLKDYKAPTEEETKKMSLEEYKRQVFFYLTKLQKHSTTAAEKLIAEYESDFPEFIETGLIPNAAGYGMETRLL